MDYIQIIKVTTFQLYTCVYCFGSTAYLQLSWHCTEEIDSIKQMWACVYWSHESNGVRILLEMLA